jgi:2-(1,2-epoxy-1,2-dihydrophenyl)acetyl-CoA isomerase
MPEDKLVSKDVENGVGTITLNRPDRLNAFNLDLANLFLETIDEFGRDKEVRAIVLRGKGRIFSTGGDVKEMFHDVKETEDRAADFRAPLAAFNKVVLAVREIPKPVLAAVHGAVAGYAFNLMLSCDLKIAEEGTRFTQAFIKLGVSPDGGGTYVLPRMVGYSRACELTMLPKEIDADTALQWGLINLVAPANRFDEFVRETAEKLAKGPALALAQTKMLLNRGYDSTLADQMEAERLAQIENSTSPDFEEGLTAFVEKREPEFGS